MPNPFDQVANGYAAAQSDANKPKTCKNCGKPVDDVPEPNKTDAEKFSKGMETQPDYIKNLKTGLGL